MLHNVLVERWRCAEGRERTVRSLTFISPKKALLVLRRNQGQANLCRRDTVSTGSFSVGLGTREPREHRSNGSRSRLVSPLLIFAANRCMERVFECEPWIYIETGQ